MPEYDFPKFNVKPKLDSTLEAFGSSLKAGTWPGAFCSPTIKE